MAAITRLGLDGYGARRAGSFAGKEDATVGPHPVGVITRLSLDGYGAKRAGSFAGKTGTEPVVDDAIVGLPFIQPPKTVSKREIEDRIETLFDELNGVKKRIELAQDKRAEIDLQGMTKAQAKRLKTQANALEKEIDALLQKQQALIWRIREAEDELVILFAIPFFH